MKRWLTIIMAAGLLLYPFATFGIDYGSQPAQSQQAPPVAQPLVREGDFAIKLAATLDLGTPVNEVEAEDILAQSGIAPLNGWISDYPMTPEIIGQLDSSLAKAGAEGRLPMTADQATRGLSYLAAQMNLPTPAGPGTTANESSQGSSQSAPAAPPQVINNYYSDEGPPVVTYYAPPPDYFYLYDWVPYPVWWVGFWFPGFFICHSFTRVVFVNSGTAVVSNHVIDPVTRRTAVIDPVTRAGGGARPVTMLRTDDGRTLRTVTEFRHAAASSPPASRSFEGGAARSEGFRTPEARRSAESLYNRSFEGVRAGGTSTSMGRVHGREYGTPNRSGRSFTAPSRESEGRLHAFDRSARPYTPPATRGYEGSGRTFTPSQPERSFNGISGSERRYETPNRFNTPSRGFERPFIGPSGPARSFSGPVGRSAPGPMRSFPDRGWHGR